MTKIIALAVLVLASVPASAQDFSSQTVEVYLNGRKALSAAGVTSVVVLDESVCRAEVSNGQIQFFGISRGETVAFAFVQDRHVQVLIRVIERPARPVPPTLLTGAAPEATGHGSVGTSAQAAIAPNGDAAYFFLHQFQWQEQAKGDRLTIRGQAQDSTIPGSPLFNANSASIVYGTAKVNLSLVDFPLEVNGGLEAKVSSFSTYNAYPIRGAAVTLKRGDDEYEFFGGATLPSYYLRLAGTRDVGGFNFLRKRNGRFFLYASTGWVGAPAGARREMSVFQTGGGSWRPNEHWAAQGTAGVSTRGILAQGTVSYSTDRFTAYINGVGSAADFPLNQLQLFFAGGSSMTAGVTRRFGNHVRGSLYYQRSESKPTELLPYQSSSDYINPNVSFSLDRRDALTVKYTYNRYRSDITPTGESKNQRVDVALNSRFGGHISNTAQLTVGALSDPLQVNSEGQFTFLESLAVPVKRALVSFGFQHSTYDPSLVKSLTAYTNLLSPALQQLFELNPLAFVQSPDLPPELRTLLGNLRPTDTQVSLSAQFMIGRRLNFSPNLSYYQDVPGVVKGPHSESIGYSLSYQVTPSLQLTSSMGNTLLFNPVTLQLQRTSIITLGINRNFAGNSRSPLPFHAPPKGTIRGIVFRDMNLNSAFNAGEPGIAGIRVELDTGVSTVTDAEGQFEFARLSPGAYRVILPLDQFKGAIRLTSPAEVTAPLFDPKPAEVDFGVVNFARLIGNVFNDYLLEGKRKPDSDGLRDIRLMLSGNGASRPIVTDGSGDFGLYDIPPGDYLLSLDPSSLPSSFEGSAEPLRIHIEPVTTVVSDIPVRAIRSISGHVYFRTANQSPQPLAGVRLAIANSTAVTDSAGSFVLRNLPAGEWTLSVVPLRPLPDGMEAPRGKIKLSHEPIDVGNTTIVISNPAMMEYLQQQPAGPQN